MTDDHKMLFQGSTEEIIEKKSRFIARTDSVSCEEEALALIESVRKKYWDASHHCFAYILGDNCQIQRFSDDGEPSGTAGKPILEVLMGSQLHNTAAVVTRYFGGTLLGTGGLVRAYSRAVKEALLSSIIIARIPGIKLKITADYTMLGKLQYTLAQHHIYTLDTIYTDKVLISALVPQGCLTVLIKALTEATSAQAVIEKQEACYFAELEGEKRVVVLE